MVVGDLWCNFESLALVLVDTHIPIVDIPCLSSTSTVVESVSVIALGAESLSIIGYDLTSRTKSKGILETYQRKTYSI